MITVSQPRLYTPEERKYYVVVERENPLPDWDYMREVTIDNTQNSNTLSDFQVQITLDTASLISNGKMKSDCGDVRVYDSNTESLLPYWVETGTENSSSTRIWVKVPSIPGGGKKTIYLFYGNPGATSQSNGDDVFEFFDDFEGTSLDTNKWTQLESGGTITISNSEITLESNPASGISISTRNYKTFPINTIAEFRAKMSGDASTFFGFSDADGSSVSNEINVHVSRGFFVRKEGTYTQLTRNTGVSVYHVWQIRRIGSDTVEFYADGTYDNGITSTTYVPVADLSLIMRSNDGDSLVCDWVRVRKFADPEPTTSVGVEQPGGDIKMKVERSW